MGNAGPGGVGSSSELSHQRGQSVHRVLWGPVPGAQEGQINAANVQLEAIESVPDVPALQDREHGYPEQGLVLQDRTQGCLPRSVSV